MTTRVNKLFKESVEKCFEYRKNHTRFECAGKKYDIDGNIWNDNFFLNEIIKMEENTIVEDKRIMESSNMEDIAKYLWELSGINIFD